MTYRQVVGIIAGCSLLMILLAACGGGGGGDPVSPLSYLDVAGTWSFAGQVTSDNCDFLSLGLASAATEALSVAQDGASLSATHVSGNVLKGNWQFAGTASGASFQLAATNPIVSTSGSCTISMGSGMNVNDISGDSGTGTMNVTADGISGCTGSCQIVWTGTWTRL